MPSADVGAAAKGAGASAGFAPGTVVSTGAGIAGGGLSASWRLRSASAACTLTVSASKTAASAALDPTIKAARRA